MIESKINSKELCTSFSVVTVTKIKITLHEMNATDDPIEMLPMTKMGQKAYCFFSFFTIFRVQRFLFAFANNIDDK